MARSVEALAVGEPGTLTRRAGFTATRDRPFYAASALLFIAGVVGTIAWCGSMPGGMPMPGGWTMSMAWMKMPGQGWLGAAVSFVGMWAVMMVAMMLPSLVPMLAGYRRALRGAGEGHLGRPTALAGAGYFSVWTAVGAGVYPIGMALGAAEMRWAGLARAAPVAAGAVVVLAGCLQLTAWKVRQLEACREAPGCCEPLFSGPWSAWRHGLHLGRHCALCCAGFMMTLLVGGVMDLGVMGVVAAAITAERLVPRPALVARATGLVVVTTGLFLIARAVGLP